MSREAKIALGVSLVFTAALVLIDPKQPFWRIVLLLIVAAGALIVVKELEWVNGKRFQLSVTNGAIETQDPHGLRLAFSILICLFAVTILGVETWPPKENPPPPFPVVLLPPPSGHTTPKKGPSLTKNPKLPIPSPPPSNKPIPPPVNPAPPEPVPTPPKTQPAVSGDCPYPLQGGDIVWGETIQVTGPHMGLLRARKLTIQTEGANGLHFVHLSGAVLEYDGPSDDRPQIIEDGSCYNGTGCTAYFVYLKHPVPTLELKAYSNTDNPSVGCIDKIKF